MSNQAGWALRNHWKVMKDTPETIAARLRKNEALAALRVELAERFPEVTVENAHEVLEWQAQRMRDLERT